MPRRNGTRPRPRPASPRPAASAVVHLRGPLRARAGGVATHEVAGATVGEALRALEAAQPALRGWILDERACLRRHIKVFVNGEDRREDAPVAPADRIDVLPAISGGGT